MIRDCKKIVKIKNAIETAANIIMLIATFVALVVSVLQVILRRKDK